MIDDTIAARLARVRREIELAAESAGRSPEEITLVAVSKTMGPDRIREAYEAGQRIFGENYVQDTLGKMDALPHDIEWHMIGHLQSNKGAKALDAYSMIQTLDRPSLAKQLEKAASARSSTVEALLQVNIGKEESKSGKTAEEITAFAGSAANYPHLKIKGLMAIPPWCEDPEESRPYFREMKKLFDEMASMELPGVEMRELSMGMSGDYKVAIEEGATIVRVGTAIFGERRK